LAKDQIRVWKCEPRSAELKVEFKQISDAYRQRLRIVVSRLRRVAVQILAEAKKSDKTAALKLENAATVVATFIDHLCVKAALSDGDERSKQNAAAQLGSQLLFERFNRLVAYNVGGAFYRRCILEEKDFLCDAERLEFLPSLRSWLLSTFSSNQKIEHKSLDDLFYFLGEKLIAAGLYFPLRTGSVFLALKKDVEERIARVGGENTTRKAYIAPEGPEYLPALFSSRSRRQHPREGGDGVMRIWIVYEKAS
jgi:hypothetical protein